MFYIKRGVLDYKLSTELMPLVRFASADEPPAIETRESL